LRLYFITLLYNYVLQPQKKIDVCQSELIHAEQKATGTTFQRYSVPVNTLSEHHENNILYEVKIN